MREKSVFCISLLLFVSELLVDQHVLERCACVFLENQVGHDVCRKVMAVFRRFSDYLSIQAVRARVKEVLANKIHRTTTIHGFSFVICASPRDKSKEFLWISFNSCRDLPPHYYLLDLLKSAGIRKIQAKQV